MSDLVVYTTPTADEWGRLKETAAMVADTEFAPKSMRGKPEAVMACLLTGRELGIGPMQALREVYIVNGRPSLAATLMVSRVRAAGHRFRTLDSTDQHAVVQITRKGETEPEPAVEFTVDDAKRAGLLGKDVWKQYPARMLWARAASAACRRDAPETLGGVVYTPEEIESIPDDGEPTTAVTWGQPETSAVSVSGEEAADPTPSTASDSDGDHASGHAAPVGATKLRKTLAAKAKVDADARARSAARSGGSAAPPSETEPYLPAWLAAVCDELDITEAKAHATLSKTFGFLRGPDWRQRLGDIAHGDIGHAQQLLHDRYGREDGEGQ
jgi:hypothetical protein